MNIEITTEEYVQLTEALSRRIVDMEQSLRDKEALIDRLHRDRHRFLERELIRRDDLTERIAKMYALADTLYNYGK
jgi:hypothetical protein